MQIKSPSANAAEGAAQLRRNRSVGGRKAALATKAARVRRDARYGPEGSHRGSAPVVDSFEAILARLRSPPAGGG